MQALFLILLTVIALLQLIRSQDIHIFLSPMFWVAVGTFFHYSMVLITQSIPEYKAVLHGEPEQRKILLLIIILVQFIFYTIAASVGGRKDEDDQMIMH
jgi:hypothetical protein